MALQLLWLGPALLLRRPSKQTQEPREGREGGDLALTQLIRQRLTQAEAGHWDQLLRDYLADLPKAESTSRAESWELDAGSTTDQLDVLAAVVRKVEGGCLRAATQLLKGDARVPTDENTLRQLRDLTAMPVDDEERSATREQVQQARACWQDVPLIKCRTVRRKLRTVKRGAEPGPSGWRNAMLVMMGERPHGCQELTRWCRLYATGSLEAEHATLWASVCLVPLDKGGGKIRPIALGEALPKLAQAVLLDSMDTHLRRSFEPSQLSVRTPGGAETLARTLQSWMANPAGRHILQIDLKNAYGQMKRSHTLKAVIEKCPGLAPQLAQQWEQGATRAWVRTQGTWTSFLSERGGWQGSPDSNPTFCYGLEAVFAQCLETSGDARRLGYADDTFLDANPVALLDSWPLVLTKLEAAGHEINPTKCHLWHSGHYADEAQSQASEQLAAMFPTTTTTITVMGTEAGGDHTLEVGPGADLAQTARKRAEAASAVAERICTLATSDLGIPKLAAAWTLLTKCCARALDYDARLVPSSVLGDVTSSLDKVLRKTADTICAKQLPDDAWDQLTLPGPLAGCGLRTSGAMLDIALWASWESHQRRARQICDDMQRAGDHRAADEAARAAQQALERRGLTVHADRRPILTQEATQCISDSGWAADFQPPLADKQVRQLGEGLRLLDQYRAALLWHRMPPPARKHLLSAGGSHTGMMWSALPDIGAKTMPDEHWRIATAARLDLLRCPPGVPCGLPKAKGKGCCGRILDQGLRHVWHCRTGAARLRIHRSIQMALMRELRQAGGHVDVERAMPAMATFHDDGSIEESIMDLTVWWPGSTAWFGLDVTIRYAGAARYVGADANAGRAAAMAEREKHRRYGRDVLPLAFEAGGRLGRESTDAMQRLADAAAEAATGHSVLTRQGLVAQWRRRLEVALHFAAADAILNALSQHEVGRQVATRWSACKPVPASFAEFVDLHGSRRGQAVPQESESSSLPLVVRNDCNLEEDLGNLITGEDFEVTRATPAAALLTADEDAAWQLFGDDMFA